MSNFPSFYDAKQVSQLFQPRMEEVIRAGLKARSEISAVDQASASRWSVMVAIDAEVGFVVPGCPLAVTGAVGDVQRAIELIYRRPDMFDEIFFTLDQHFRFSIFHRYWWINAAGEHPKAYTRITYDDVASGRWQSVIMQDWSGHYVRKLGQIDIWPDHCLVGTEQAQLVPALEEAIWWHAVARNTKPIPMLKGDVLEVEFYGPFGPNVHVPGHPRGGLITDALNLLGRYERVFFWGEARDFCVLSGLLQHVNYFEGRPEILKRIYLIKDCTSLVFGDQQVANDAELEKLAKMGVHIVTSDQVLSMVA